MYCYIPFASLFFYKCNSLMLLHGISRNFVGNKDTHVVVWITRRVRFHKFSGFSALLHWDFLSFIVCSHYSYEQFVSGPLKPLHIISKTLNGIWCILYVNVHITRIFQSIQFFCEICTSEYGILLSFQDKNSDVYICLKFRCDNFWGIWLNCLAYSMHTFLRELAIKLIKTISTTFVILYLRRLGMNSIPLLSAEHSYQLILCLGKSSTLFCDWLRSVLLALILIKGDWNLR